MDENIREAILYLDPLKATVKAELIRENGAHLVKYIPCDALASELQAHVHVAPMHSDLLPPGCIALTAFQDGWDITLDCGLDHCTIWYYNTEFPDFPLPRILLRCRVKTAGSPVLHSVLRIPASSRRTPKCISALSQMSTDFTCAPAAISSPAMIRSGNCVPCRDG